MTAEQFTGESPILQLTPKQREATRLLKDPEVTFILYGGAIRGAKTIWLAIVFAQLAMQFPNSRWAIMRSDTPKITKNLLPSVSYIYSKQGIRERIVNINKSQNTFTFDNGSVVFLYSESFNSDKDLERFHGLEVNGFGLDELSEFQQKTLNKCFERAGSWSNAGTNKSGKECRPLVLATCNPTKNWVKTEIYDRYINSISGLPNGLKKGWRYVQAKITDNPFVKKSFYKSLLENMTPGNLQRFVDGDWDYVESNGHEWIYNFSYSQHVKKVDYNPNLPSFLTFDFNVWPYMTLLCFQLVPKENGYKVRFYDEFCLSWPHNTAEDCCNAWINKYPRVHGKVPVSYCGDSSGESRVPGFGDKKAFNPIRTTLAPYLHSTSDRVYKRQFFNEFVRKFMNDLFSGNLRGGAEVEIEIDQTRCPNLIKDIQESIESPNGGFIKEKAVDEKTKVKYEKNGHCVDAAKYGLLSVFSELYETRYHRNNDY